MNDEDFSIGCILLAAALTGCSVGGSSTVSGVAVEAASTPCEKRDAAMKDLTREAQDAMSSAVHSSFEGRGARSSDSIKKQEDRIERKYGGLSCSGETMEHFRNKIHRMTEEIDQLQ